MLSVVKLRFIMLSVVAPYQGTESTIPLLMSLTSAEVQKLECFFLINGK